MNDKEKLLRDYGRMCLKPNCYDCRIGEKGGFNVGCQRWISEHPEEAAEIIEKWAAEHPVKTRQDLFLEHYPKSKPLHICPNDIEYVINPDCDNRDYGVCMDCVNKYWSQEVTNE